MGLAEGLVNLNGLQLHDLKWLGEEVESAPTMIMVPGGLGTAENFREQLEACKIGPGHDLMRPDPGLLSQTIVTWLLRRHQGIEGTA